MDDSLTEYLIVYGLSLAAAALLTVIVASTFYFTV
jgi:hypothetical protein